MTSTNEKKKRNILRILILNEKNKINNFFYIIDKDKYLLFVIINSKYILVNIYQKINFPNKFAAY
jgi:hypothetical protein